MKRETREWLDKAEGDFATASRERAVEDNPNYDAVCFHAQQAAEKHLKARLVTVIDKAIADRMASTVRHYRARGRHAVSGMANLVFRMLDQGMSDADVCNELGIEPEELLRLKHITGFSKLFADREYRRAWMARSQVEERRRYQQGEGAAVS